MIIPETIELLSAMLIRAYRTRKCKTAELADWTLNFQTLKSAAPPLARGRYAPADYSYFDLSVAADLSKVCHDFVRCAVYSVRRTEKHKQLKLITR